MVNTAKCPTKTNKGDNEEEKVDDESDTDDNDTHEG